MSRANDKTINAVLALASLVVFLALSLLYMACAPQSSSSRMEIDACYRANSVPVTGADDRIHCASRSASAAAFPQ